MKKIKLEKIKPLEGYEEKHKRALKLLGKNYALHKSNQAQFKPNRSILDEARRSQEETARTTTRQQQVQVTLAPTVVVPIKTSQKSR